MFDPLALILILAAEQTFIWIREDKKKKEDEPAYEPDDGQLTDEQYEKIKQEADIDDYIAMQKFFDDGKELAKSIDDNNGYLPANYASTQSYLNKPWVWPNSTTDEGLVPKQEVTDLLDISVPVDENIPTQEANADRFDPQPIRGLQAPATDEEPINPLTKSVQINDNPNQIVIPDLSINTGETPPNAGFGTEFPIKPQKGDMFLRVDYLPSKLYKWNEKKWIEISKEQTDQYAYDQEYIKHLIEKLDCGEYDIDLLSAVEQDQISRYLNEQSTRK